MYTASGGPIRFQKIKKSKLFKNLNDAYIISMHICLQLENKVKMEQIIVFRRNRESPF